MAHYFGEVQGTRGKATRLGTRSSGLRVTAASWSGAIRVELEHINGRERFLIVALDWPSGDSRRILGQGWLDEERETKRAVL
jgi:hypothetical protein